MSDYLADGLVAELILWRLPVDSIIECRLVCKSWYSLITSSHFISTHLRRQKNPQICVHQWNSGPDDFENCEFLFENGRSLLFRLPHLPPRPRIRVTGSVNGLICVSIGVTTVDRVVNFVVFNPAIGHFITVPPVPSSWGRIRSYDVMGFGFDERNLDFIVLAVFRGYAGFIYSLNSRCWRRITCSLPRNWEMEFSNTLFVNGKFYWLVLEGIALKSIMVFDIKTESFGRVLLPESVENCTSGFFDILEFGESSIALIQCIGLGSVANLWMLKENSWSKKLTLDSSKMEVLSIRNKDQVLIRSKSGFIALQNIVKKKKNQTDHHQLGELTKIMDVNPGLWFCHDVHKYVPSLVLLNNKNQVDDDVPALTPAIQTRAAPTRAKRKRTTPTRTMPNKSAHFRSKQIEISPTPVEQIETF